VNPQDTSTLWLKYEEALSKYEEERKRYKFWTLLFFTGFDTSILKDDRFFTFFTLTLLLQ